MPGRSDLVAQWERVLGFGSRLHTRLLGPPLQRSTQRWNHFQHLSTAIGTKSICHNTWPFHPHAVPPTCCQWVCLRTLSETKNVSSESECGSMRFLILRIWTLSPPTNSKHKQKHKKGRKKTHRRAPELQCSPVCSVTTIAPKNDLHGLCCGHLIYI